MFYDWLTIEQDFGYPLPILSDVAYLRIHVDTGESSDLCQPVFQHKGSFCDQVSISVRGSVLKMSGNPSRWNRLENLFGIHTIDACVQVYNTILSELGLPAFTKCTKIWPRQAKENERAGLVTDGACIREIHLTSNRRVGKANEDDYIAGLSTLPYRNSMPRLHSNGKSVDWLSKKGNATLIYPTVYNKAHELKLHALSKIENRFGKDSDEVRYLQRVIEFCEENGIVRFEQKLKSRFLQKHGLLFWGLTDYSILITLHDTFISLDKSLMVTSMDFDTISEHLISQGVVDNTRSANTTAMYAIQWMHGHSFNFDKKQVQTHRARLRKIGIDIAQRCNISKFSPIFVRNRREVVVSDCPIPEWYRKPNFLRVA
ncbi:Replication-associated protein G2P [Pectobacterium brasiliense]|uniref:Replication-associated protein G2P n=1 Tax=Pectobacterium brasiliense TaxID=180957 RepID=A0AAE2WCK5_9GAMM|nr:phage/plasmid replication protein [Pectobacterium brasiliense]MBN3050850.1 Replication-associated protein G2P [Pectobacterium brasiliense]